MAENVKVPPFDTAPETVVGATPRSEFAFDFPFWDAADIQVSINGEMLSAAAFTVQGYFVQNGEPIEGGYGSGLVTLNTPVSNATVIIDRLVEGARESQFSRSAPLGMPVLNADLNKLTARQQDVARFVRRVKLDGLTTGLDGSAARAAIGALSSSALTGALKADLVVTDDGLTQPGSLLTPLADRAYDDLIAKFWDGDRIYGRDGGYQVTNERPFFWTKEMAFNNLYWVWKRNIAGNRTDAAAKIASDWADMTATYTADELSSGRLFTDPTDPGIDIGAQDDVSWNVNYLCQVHEVTGDPLALAYAMAQINSGREQFADPEDAGSGLLYRVTGFVASTTYEAPMAMAAAYIHEQNDDVGMLAYAVETWAWMKNRLKSASRGIYWRILTLDPESDNYLLPQLDGLGDAGAPIGRGFSYSLLVGTMSMAVLSARLYAITGNVIYLNEARSIVQAMLRYDTFLRPGDLFFSDSDGWVNGWAFPAFVDEVLTLPDADPSGRCAQVIVNTGAAIARRRTNQWYTSRYGGNAGVTFGAGFYGADWTGPEQGLDKWAVYAGNGIWPEVIQTTGNNMSVIMAAAMVPNGVVKTQLVTQDVLNDMALLLADVYAPLNIPTFEGPVTAERFQVDGELYIDRLPNGDGVVNLAGGGQVIYRAATSVIDIVIGNTVRLSVSSAGEVTAAKFSLGANQYLQLFGGDLALVFGNNAFLSYDQNTFRFLFVIAGTVRGYVDATGFHDGAP